jgi:hypothetical protein
VLKTGALYHKPYLATNDSKYGSPDLLVMVKESNPAPTSSTSTLGIDAEPIFAAGLSYNAGNRSKVVVGEMLIVSLEECLETRCLYCPEDVGCWTLLVALSKLPITHYLDRHLISSAGYGKDGYG